MNKLQRLLGVGAIALASITGCKYQTEYSKIKHEIATVTLREHQDATNSIGFGVAIGNPGAGLAMSHGERYYIFFDGEIDFEINNKDIFNRFNKGDSAYITYKEIDLLRFKNVSRGGIRKLFKKAFFDYEFVDAQPKK